MTSEANREDKWTVASFVDVRRSAPAMLKIMSLVLKIVSQTCKPNRQAWGTYTWTSHWLMHKFIASITGKTGEYPLKIHDFSIDEPLIIYCNLSNAL